MQLCGATIGSTLRRVRVRRTLGFERRLNAGASANDYTDLVRLVQISSGSGKIRVAVVDGDYLQLLNGCDSVYDLAQTALREGKPLCESAKQQISDEKVEYGPIYRGANPSGACCRRLRTRNRRAVW